MAKADLVIKGVFNIVLTSLKIQVTSPDYYLYHFDFEQNLLS